MSGFAAVGLDNVYLSSLGAFLDAFELVRIRVALLFSERASLAMESPIHLLTPDGRPVRMAGGRRIAGDAALDAHGQYALIHIPGFLVGDEASLDARLAGTARLCEWLRRQHEGGALISASGSAVFVLAESGLLSGHTVAVTRPLIPFFRRRHPGMRIDHRKAIVEHERVLTSIGLAADSQLMVRLVERTTTVELARWLADVTGLHRTADGQLAENDLVAHAQLWLEDRLAQDARIADLADDLAVSQQTLLRHFQRHLGMTPRDYMRKLRVETAQTLLLRTNRPVQEIAGLVGYDDVHAFAKAFRTISGMSASRFRLAKKRKDTAAK